MFNLNLTNKARFYRYVLAFSLAIILIVLLIVLIAGHNKSNFNPNAGSKYDPNSGETISNPPGKGPDHYGSKTASPSFLGISQILNYGVSFTELVNLETAFKNYLQPTLAKASPTSTYVVSIDVKSIMVAPHNANSSSTNDNMTFDVTFNQQNTLYANFVYSLLNNQVELYLYKSNGGSLVFDSGLIGS